MGASGKIAGVLDLEVLARAPGITGNAEVGRAASREG